MVGKRPPSLSDSNIYMGDYKFMDVDEFNLQISCASKIVEPDKITIVQGNKTLEILIDYAMRFNFHIFLISIFEIIFYFTFVSKDEDAGILQTTNYYTNSIINSCTNLSDVEIIYINTILDKIVNASQIITTGAIYAKERLNQNNTIYTLSLTYVGIIAVVQLGLLIINYLLKFKIQWKHIILENIALVGFLGLYEFMFFETVIKKYNAESPQEISALFVRGLQNQCKLLTDN